MFTRFTLLVCLVLVAHGAVVAEDDKSEENQARKFRMQLMQDTVAGFKLSDDESGAKFVEKPLLRYSDPTRGIAGTNVLLDASVWRLGDKGRPLALVTLEIYGRG